MRKTVNLLQEFSIPLIAGVIAALIVANVDPTLYMDLVRGSFNHWGNLGGGISEHGPDAAWWEHYTTMHFIIDDIFMVFFFGVATKEITESIPKWETFKGVSIVNPIPMTGI